MSIIIDFSHIFISNIMMHNTKNPREPITLEICRYMILNSLKYQMKQFKPKYGNDVILATDSRQSWRKEFFPYYKANRKVVRDQSKLDWPNIFQIHDQILQEIQDNFSYVVVSVGRAEGDDIVAVMTREATDPVIIISGDKDLSQLQTKFVKQWSPVLKVAIAPPNDSSRALKEHIMRGDRGDGGGGGC